MKKVLSFLLACLFFLTLFGCKKGEEGVELKQDNKKYKIAYITDTLGEENKSNKEVIKGIEKSFENMDYSLEVEVPDSAEKYTTIANILLTSTTYDLVLSNSYSVSSSLISLHKDYPNSNLGFIGYEDGTKSGMSVTFKSEEGAFLAGALAAKYTKSNKIGYIGAYENKNTEYLYAFMSGVKAISDSKKVYTTYTNSYMNTTEGAKQANYLHKKGVDVIFTVCGAGAIGVNNVAKEKGFKVIDSDLYTESDLDVKLGEVYLNYENATITICESIIYESFKKTVNDLGITEEAVDLSLNNNFIEDDSDIKKTIDKLKEEISKGKIKVPVNNKSYKAFNYK